VLGNGNGFFQDPVDFALNAPARSIVVGDLNGDGKPDLVLVTLGTQQQPEQVVVMLNTTGP